MAGSVNDLVVYRFECAIEALEDARLLFHAGRYKVSLNRSYYSIFHAMRAVNALDGFDSSKHSGVMAHFNQFHVKEGHFPKEASKIIKGASLMREQADYEDFFVVCGQDADEQIQKAEQFLSLVKNYLEMRQIHLHN